MESSGPDCPDNAIPAGEEIPRLIRWLQSLVEGQSAVEELVACGIAAIPALRDFLLSGRIASVPQPRIWAVEALARLGARDVLIEYLQASRRTSDPQLGFAEEAVRNSAARRLGAWRDPQTFEVLLDLCRSRSLPGVIEALAEFGNVEAIPSLDRALDDDLCRPAAEEGLRRLGVRARTALLLSAVTPLPNASEEIPSSLCRRRSVSMLLTEIGVDAASWPQLRPLLAERDPELLVRAALMASVAAEHEDRLLAAKCLVAALAQVPWHVVKEAEEALLALSPESLPPIRAELRRRSANPPRVRAGDEVLRLLLRVSQKLAASPR